MAYSRATIPGDGVTTAFAVPFPYIDQTHIEVTVDGEAAVFTWNSPSVIEITPAPTGAVTITRNTPKSEALVQFQDGGIFNEQLMELLSTQLFYLAQEQVDETDEAVSTYVSLANLLAVIQQETAASSLHEANALTSETNAAASAAAAASTAATSQTTLNNIVTSAQASASASVTAAANSATAAATSATNSANSATASATSATNSANSASASATSATNAAASATSATASKNAAATSETNAAASASAAAASAISAAASAGTFVKDGWTIGVSVEGTLEFKHNGVLKASLTSGGVLVAATDIGSGF